MSADAYNIKIHTIYRKLKRGVDIEMKEKKGSGENKICSIFYLLLMSIIIFFVTIAADVVLNIKY